MLNGRCQRERQRVRIFFDQSPWSKDKQQKIHPWLLLFFMTVRDMDGW